MKNIPKVICATMAPAMIFLGSNTTGFAEDAIKVWDALMEAGKELVSFKNVGMGYLSCPILLLRPYPFSQGDIYRGRWRWLKIQGL